MKPALIDPDPATLALNCTKAELSDRRFDLARRGYQITSETATPDGWRIEARRCDCEVCTAGRTDRARMASEARKAKPITPAKGKAFFARLRQEIGQV